VWKRRLRLGKPLAGHVRARLLLLADARTKARHEPVADESPALPQRLVRIVLRAMAVLGGQGPEWRTVQRAIDRAAELVASLDATQPDQALSSAT
jgi:hypothetical protein